MFEMMQVHHTHSLGRCSGVDFLKSLSCSLISTLHWVLYHKTHGNGVIEGPGILPDRDPRALDKGPGPLGA